MDEQNGSDLARRNHIAGLLARHPDLAAAETDEVLDFLKNGSMIDIGMLRGDPVFKPKIERIRAENSAHFQLGASRSLLVGLLIALPFLLVCWLILDWGA